MLAALSLGKLVGKQLSKYYPKMVELARHLVAARSMIIRKACKARKRLDKSLFMKLNVRASPKIPRHAILSFIGSDCPVQFLLSFKELCRPSRSGLVLVNIKASGTTQGAAQKEWQLGYACTPVLKNRFVCMSLRSFQSLVT